MAKRYGRNQRRKHREQIDALSDYLRVAIDRKVAEERRAERLEHRIENWAQRIARVCGEDHPFNEEIRRRMVSALPQVFRAVPPMKLDFARVDAPVPTEVAFHYIELAANSLEARQSAPADVGQATVILETPEGRSAIYVDRRYAREARRDPKFEQYVSRCLIAELDKVAA